MAGVPSMIHFLAISLLLACIAGMVSKPPTPEMTKKLCQLIKARFINDTPSGSFVEAVDEGVMDILMLLPCGNAIFTKQTTTTFPPLPHALSSLTFLNLLIDDQKSRHQLDRASNNVHTS